MPLQINDRVKETSSTIGIVPVVLSGASLGYQNVASSIATSNTFPYVIELSGGSEWEIGIGSYVSGNNSIIRTQVLNSSNNGNIVDFSAGQKNVFISIPAVYAALSVRDLSQFAATTSANLASIISDETGSGKLVFSNNAVLVAPDIGVATGTSLTLSGNVSSNLSLVGSSAITARFPNALSIVTNVSSNTQNENHNIGLIAEGVANASNSSIYGIGVYGVGYTNSGTRSGGVVGEGHVTSSSDGGSAIGVRGYAHDIHAGGLNVGLYGDALNSSIGNYALAMNNGNILSNFAQTWYLNGGLTFTGGANTVIIPNLVSSNANFTVATGTAPFTVASNTIVSNLNSDLLDGQHGTYYTGLTGSAWDTANTGVSIATAAFSKANTETIGQAAFGVANTGTTIATSGFGVANTGVTIAQSSFTQANTGVSIATAGFGVANTGVTIATAAFGVANTGTTIATSAFTQANTGVTIAQAAYNTANTKFSSSGGTISGSVTITTDLNVNGNVYLSGNVTTLSSNNLSVNDPLIYLAQNNPGNVQDIGIVGHFVSGTYQHTGFVRDATDGVWKLFSNVAAEPSTTIDFTGAIYDVLQVGTLNSSNATFTVAQGTTPFTVVSNTVVSNLNADYLDGQHGTYYTGLTGSAWSTANTGVTIGQAAFSRANTETIGQAAFTQANTGVTIAQAAFTQANTGVTIAQAGFGVANTGVTIATAGFTQANTGFTQANTGVTIGQAAFTQANTGVTIAQAAFSRANTETIGQAAFGVANTGVTIGQAAFSRANTETIGQAAFTQANTGVTIATSAFGVANTGVTIAQAAFTQANTKFSSSGGTITGNTTVIGVVTGNTFVSTIAIGTAPLTVSSTTVVTNLNADYLDGQHGAYYTTAGNLSGTIPSAVLGNSTHYIGTTAVTLNRASASLALTGITSIDGSSVTVASQGAVANNTTGTGLTSGLSHAQVYTNGYPTSYGNVMTMYGTGVSQLLLGWSGTTGADADNYIRSLRDSAVGTAGWSIWRKILTDANISSYASPLAGSSSITTTGTVTSGTWSGSFGAVSGANLTALTAGNLSGTIPSAVLGNSTHYIGTTAVTLNRASASLALTGITSIDGSAASVTNAVTFNSGGTGDASGTTFNGSAARTISYNSVGASPLAGSSSITTTGTVTSGTWSGSFGAVSGANLTGLTAGNLSGTIPSTVIANSKLVDWKNQTAQFALSGGGTVTTTTTSILWSNRVIAIPVENTEYSSSGYIDISCPTSGTVVYYNGSNVTTTVTCTAAGIPLAAWEALYYQVTEGQAYTSDQTKFRVVNYQNSTWSPGAGWICIAVRNGDDNSFKWLPGQINIPQSSNYVSSTGIASWAGGATITNDTTTNATYYPSMTSATSGSMSTATVSNSKLYFNPSTGTLSSTIFDSLSDESVKDNISIISDSLSIINQLNGVEFTWKDNDKPSAGVIAQQLESVLPALVDTNSDTGLKSVNYSGIIGYLIEGIKELNSEIVELKKMIKGN
jgi:hypothetical protein